MEATMKLRSEVKFEALHIRDGKVIGRRRIGAWSWYARLWRRIKLALGDERGLVTTAGVVYLANALVANTNPMSNFTYHDCGTGTGSALVGNTALGTPAGSARVSGTPSAPGSTNVFQSVATITPGSALAITEWGLFSASSSGTLWDRRVFSAINVGASDSIQFTYSLTVTAGGS